MAALVDSYLAKLKRAGGHMKAERINEWFKRLLLEFNQRILPIDLAIAREAGNSKMPRSPEAPIRVWRTF
ncbi:hypothetical protein NKH10_24580 [Mesorhizobium sp. M1340]|uniref:hypothetical protein n=1 Tax=unclassified Mesorhizobium TaxID=325217 RepID=UPI0033389C2E